MVQNAIPTYVAKNPSNQMAPLQVDGQNAQQTTSGGLSAALNVTAAKVIKASAGRACRIIVVAPGTTSGSLTLNDCATTGAATTANQVFTIAYGSMAAGQVIDLQVPVANGLVVSAVPGGGSPQYVVTYN